MAPMFSTQAACIFYFMDALAQNITYHNPQSKLHFQIGPMSLFFPVFYGLGNNSFFFLRTGAGIFVLWSPLLEYFLILS